MWYVTSSDDLYKMLTKTELQCYSFWHFPLMIRNYSVISAIWCLELSSQGTHSLSYTRQNKQIPKIILLQFTSVGLRVESQEAMHTHTHASTYVVTYKHTKPTQII